MLHTPVRAQDACLWHSEQEIILLKLAERQNTQWEKEEKGGDICWLHD